MAIYRGPGGAGDATGDATNASALALAARDEAIAAAAAAASSETAAGNSATDADASADASAVSASNAATSASAASTFATNASNSATAASSSAATATTKASQASTSATAAASSASAASTSASNASTSATNAASSASTASTQAANASNSASSAATYATNAASSATAASSSASDAAASAALINDSLLVHKATDETITGTKTFTANQIISVTDNTDAALRITQLGTGNALLVEDASNPDSSPFVINAAGSVGVGTSSPVVKLHVAGRLRVVEDTSIADLGSSATGVYLYNRSNSALTFGTNDTERMRIDSSGLVTMYENVGIGEAASNSYGLYLGSEITSGVNQYGVGAISTLAGTSWSAAVLTGMPLKASTAYTSIAGVRAINPTTATGATATYLYGVKVEDQTLGTNNYGIASAVSSGTNKWNIYASGTAQNYFAGNVGIGKTPTYKVDVAGDVNITGDFYKNGTIFSGGAKGGGSDAVFYENNQTVTTNYTITSGNNAMSAGPITVSSGVTVTVPSGSVWTIV